MCRPKLFVVQKAHDQDLKRIAPSIARPDLLSQRCLLSADISVTMVTDAAFSHTIK